MYYGEPKFDNCDLKTKLFYFRAINVKKGRANINKYVIIY